MYISWHWEKNLKNDERELRMMKRSEESEKIWEWSRIKKWLRIMKELKKLEDINMSWEWLKIMRTFKKL